jgi:DNA end-binding protein Ku
MPPRAIGSGTISFGLVSIPVKLYSSSAPSSDIHFNMLHKGCGARLKQRYYCAKEDVEVARGEMVKGYEFAKDQYVTFTDEEIKALSEESTRAIEIAEFVPASAVDPLFYDAAYFLGADKGGDRAYALLAEAMRKTARVGLAKYATRGKQYLVMLRPVDGGLVMQQLRYPDELRSIEELELARVEVKDAELALAVQFIDQVARDEFHPEHYEDDVKLRIQAAIQQKVEGEEVTVAPGEAPKAQIIDIMEALKASLAATAPAEPKTKRAASARTGADKARAKPSARKKG